MNLSGFAAVNSYLLKIINFIIGVRKRRIHFLFKSYKLCMRNKISSANVIFRQCRNVRDPLQCLSLDEVVGIKVASDSLTPLTTI